MSDLHQMTANELEEWYKRYYAPNNARLVIVGDVEPEKVYAMSQSLFGDLQPGKVPLRKAFPEPPLIGKKTVSVKAPAKLPMLMMGYTVPSVISAKDSWKPYALVVLSGVLSGGDSARFSKHLIRGAQSASEAEAYYSPFSRYATQFIFVGTPSTKEGLATMEKDMLQEISRIRSEKISDAELARVKQQLIAQKVFEKDSIFGQAMEIGLLETVGAGWRTGDRFAEKVRAVTAEQVLAVAKEYFVDERLTRAELIPLAANERKPS